LGKIAFVVAKGAGVWRFHIMRKYRNAKGAIVESASLYQASWMKIGLSDRIPILERGTFPVCYAR
jgi:hypothetical protein